MEAYLTAEILKALTNGDATKFIAYILIFIFIWIEVRGMKKELANLNLTVGKSFAEGEKRFEMLEDSHKLIEHRLSMLENRGKH